MKVIIKNLLEGNAGRLVGRISEYKLVNIDFHEDNTKTLTLNNVLLTANRDSVTVDGVEIPRTHFESITIY